MGVLGENFLHFASCSLPCAAPFQFQIPKMNRYGSCRCIIFEHPDRLHLPTFNRRPSMTLWYHFTLFVDQHVYRFVTSITH